MLLDSKIAKKKIVEELKIKNMFFTSALSKNISAILFRSHKTDQIKR